MNFEENALHETFDRYITGQMSEGEKTEFLQSLDKDPALKEAFSWHLTVVAGIRQARRDELKDYIKKNAKITYIGNIWSRSWVIASAAIVTIFLGTYIILQNYANNPSEKARSIAIADSQAEELDTTPGLREAGPVEDVLADEIHKHESEKNNKVTDIVTMPENTREDIAPSATSANKTVPYYIIQKKLATEGNENKAATTDMKAARNIDVYYEPGTAAMYKYDRKTLVLYSISKDDKISLYELNKAAYLYWQKEYYPLTADGEAHELTKVKDIETLRSLPPKK